LSRPTFRARRRLDIDAAYASILAAGFATAEFDGQPEPETLQCRDELDRTNWIGLVIQCQAAIALGAGDAMIPSPGLRCTSNRMYVISFSDAVTRMFALLSQVQSAQANWWRLKDLCTAAETAEDLNAIDLAEGWP
jgi:hypothetical protein